MRPLSVSRLSIAMRRRVALWTITIAVELGYSLAKALSATQPLWTAWVGAVALSVASGVVAAGTRRVAHGVRRRVAWGAAIICIAVACLGYGFCREADAPASVRPWLGQTLTASGHITSVVSGKSWRYYRIHVTSITLTYAPGVGVTGPLVHRCNIDVDFRGGSVHSASSLQIGDAIVLRGMLVQSSPSSSNRSSKTHLSQPVRQGYALLGRVIAHQADSNGLSNRIREWLLVQLKRGTNAPTADASLMESIVFGETQVAASTTQNFQRAGLLHILAASGANVLMLTQTAEWVVRPVFVRTRLPHQVWYVWLMVCVWGFAELCQMAPSIERAALMTSYRLLGTMLGRQPTLSTVTAVAGLVMAVTTPSTLSSTSAILSFAATIAVARAVTGGRRHVQRSPVFAVVHHLLQSVRITAWVELYVTPLTIVLFQQWTPFSVVANAGAEPVMVILLPLTASVFVLAAMAAVLPTMVTLWATHAMGVVSLAILHLLTLWAGLVAAWPKSLITFQSPSVIWVIAYYLLLLSVPFILRYCRFWWSRH